MNHQDPETPVNIMHDDVFQQGNMYYCYRTKTVVK